MIVNSKIIDENNNTNKSKLKRVITTENTRPDTNLFNDNFGYNNLNSVLKHVDEDVVQIIKIPKIETAKIDDNIIKEINSNDNSKNEKLCLNTNIKKVPNKI